ncbi:MAG: phosphoribosylanthranilate isomerase [Spirochaetes bacterium]|nr:phosphoribosylanthranilate isomerase [Spirochaetota bacterium]
MFVKVCGITSLEQIDWAVDLGYSAVGIVLHPGSVRHCNADYARKLALYGRGRVSTIAVGVTFEEVADCYHDFDLVQVYENCPADRLISAGDTEERSREGALFLYDASRGSGEEKELPPWLHDVSYRLIISGGLRAGTVAGVIREYRPFGVDVSSGVESRRGIKDYNLMKQFITEVHNALR